MIHCKSTLPGLIYCGHVSALNNSLTHFMISRFTNVSFVYTELSMRHDVKLHTVQQIYAPSVNRLTGSHYCFVTGYDLAASFMALLSSDRLTDHRGF